MSAPDRFLQTYEMVLQEVWEYKSNHTTQYLLFERENVSWNHLSTPKEVKTKVSGWFNHVMYIFQYSDLIIAFGWIQILYLSHTTGQLTPYQDQIVWTIPKLLLGNDSLYTLEYLL